MGIDNSALSQNIASTLHFVDVSLYLMEVASSTEKKSFDGFQIEEEMKNVKLWKKQRKVEILIFHFQFCFLKLVTCQNVFGN